VFGLYARGRNIVNSRLFTVFLPECTEIATHLFYDWGTTTGYTNIYRPGYQHRTPGNRGV